MEKGWLYALDPEPVDEHEILWRERAKKVRHPADSDFGSFSRSGREMPRLEVT